MNGELPRRQSDYDLGVLFVHGIGQQRAGRTVVSFGTALYQWLLRWDCDKESSLAQAPELVLSRAVLQSRTRRPRVGKRWTAATGTKTPCVTEVLAV